MKKSLQLLTSLTLLLFAGALSGQNIQLTLRYNIPQARYEVYARPDASNPSFTWGSSQISVVTPASVPDMALVVTSVNAGAWSDNSRIYAPTAQPANDFHGVGSGGAPVSLVANTEILIFHFTLPGGGCTDGLRLFVTGSDPNSAAAGMGGGDFGNNIGNGTLFDSYTGNYNNTGTKCFPDTDGDGLTDNADLDDDNDGILDTVEDAQFSADVDGDGIPNRLDLDSDNDGINDVIEAGGTDANQDGIADGTPDAQGIPSSAGTGLTVPDTDGDTRPNPYDLDSDNDGINDLVESGNPALTDANGDGQVDGTDPDSDGILGPADGTPNTRGDLNDPIPTNTDGTGGANYVDLDSDGDGLTDLAESGIPNVSTLDANSDGKIDNPADADSDGIPQVVDGAPSAFGDANNSALPDSNNNSNPDYTDPNNAPVITSNGGGATGTQNVAENTTAVTTVTATDSENAFGTPKFQISGGADAARFTINASTGVVSFVAAPDFETPTDAGANNVYDVQVTVTDAGGLTDVQDIAVTVTNVNEVPVITSNGGGATGTQSVAENTTAVTTVTATDPENAFGSPKFAITGGADAAKFTIVASTGVLSFVAAPDFESPTDAGANNVYDVQVTVTDAGGLTDVQDIAVTVTNVNEAPVITSNGGGATGTQSVAENTTAVTTVTATDPENAFGSSKFAITGGADAAKFTIVASTGVLSFVAAPDFESPTDAGANNVYDVQVTVTDAGGLTDAQDLAVTVTNGNEAPVITSNGGGATGTQNVAENTTAVTTVTATDPENAFGSPKFTITGGADAAKFTIDATTGVVSFVAAPDFESPTDAGANNVYDVQVTVTDAGGLTDVQDIAVTVTNVNEAPVITSNGGGATGTQNVAENTTAVTTVTATDPENAFGTPKFTITGGADAAKFTIDATTGVVSFVGAPNFENPTDAGADNVYNVQVTVTDANGLTDVQDIAVTVTNANEAPVITSNGGGATGTQNVAENTTAVTTVTATDPENAFGSPKFTITGGADAAKFTIDATTGVVSFVAAPDFESPTDAGANNVYDVQVTVTDAGGLTDVQDIAVTVTNVNEAPVITSNGGGATGTQNVVENTTAVTTVTATDPENTFGSPKFAITGGADAAKFTIDATTGVVSFVAAPDFESPTDAGANNVYDVQVTVTDASGLTDVQDIAVTVTNGNDAPVITSNGGGATGTQNVAENTTAVTTVTATDPENAFGTPKFTITGGADAAKFTIDATTGVVSFVAAPNFENPTDAGANNVYDVQVTVTDAGGLTDVQDIAVTVTNTNEAPVITSNGGGATGTQNVAENTTAVTTVTATDPENAFGTPKFAITGGADAAKFTIDATTGVVSFVAAPDFESPTDAGADNVYNVQVTVTDASGLTDVQDIAVTVTDVDENGRLKVKVLLQGALFNTATAGIMRDDLRSNGYLPLNDPYTGAGTRYTHAGSGAAATTTSGVLNANVGTNDAIVDWVFVELRNSANSATVVQTRAALLQRDGDVVDPTDGISPLMFTGLSGSSYFVSIKHRNHLGAMTATVQTLTVAGTDIDFTTMTNANLFNNTGYDGAEMVTVGSVKALWAGNATADNKVKYQGTNNDNAVILNQVLNHPGNTTDTYNYDIGFGYWNGDINMDGKVKYQGAGNDPNFIFTNVITNYTLNLLDLYNYDLFLEQLP